MESKLRERLVGALVLVALAVLVLPWLLDDDKRSGSFQSQIPAQPVNNASRVIELQQPRPLAELNDTDVAIAASTQAQSLPEDLTAAVSPPNLAVSAEPMAPAVPISSATPSVIPTSRAGSELVAPIAQVVAAPAVVTPADNLAVLPKAAADKGFVIQLGSFGNIENAKALVAKLQSRGFKAYWRAYEKSGETHLRVLVGPYLEQKAAQSDVTKLQLLAGNSALVSAFDPLKH